MNRELQNFVPNYIGENVEINESMIPVVSRIRRYLSKEELFEHFCSAPQETGGVRRFPYYRVDEALNACRDCLYIMEEDGQKKEEKEEFYKLASKLVMELILWVEVGFEGIDNFANHRASRNWTSLVGHNINDQERAKWIRTEGKVFYDSTLRDFVKFRKEMGIRKDCFTTIGLEPLLKNWE